MSIFRVTNQDKKILICINDGNVLSLNDIFDLHSNNKNLMIVEKISKEVLKKQSAKEKVIKNG